MIIFSTILPYQFMFWLPMLLLLLLLRCLSAEKVLLKKDWRHFENVVVVVVVVDVVVTTWPSRAKLTKVEQRKGLIESFVYLISSSYQSSLLLLFDIALRRTCFFDSRIVQDIENLQQDKTKITLFKNKIDDLYSQYWWKLFFCLFKFRSWPWLTNLATILTDILTSQDVVDLNDDVTHALFNSKI